MADIVYDENFTPPGKKDFKNFRQGCLDDEGWTEAYKGDNLVVLTKNVCSFFVGTTSMTFDICFLL